MNFLEKILAEKAIEVENMPLEEVNQVKTRPSFYETVKKNPEKVHLLGEIKRASPSKGNINTEIDILAQAKKYQTAGVSGISVLTDEVCERCGKPMAAKRGRYGQFLGCTGNPECKNIKKISKV